MEMRVSSETRNEDKEKKANNIRWDSSIYNVLGSKLFLYKYDLY